MIASQGDGGVAEGWSGDEKEKKSPFKRRRLFLKLLIHEGG
jgi:hypothetical protein